MKKYFHTSLFRTRDAAGLHRGGVEVFGGYLERAIPGLQCISFPDCPGYKDCQDLSDYDKAYVLNNWLWGSGIVNEDSIVVTDGYWGLGLEGKVARIISVCHGTYYGRFLQHQIHPWGEVVGMDHIEAQAEMWRNSEPVAVALEGKIELEKQGLECAAVIYHGVDLDVFKPTGKGEIFMYAATSNRKGLDLLPHISELADVGIHFMDEHSGDPKKKAERLNKAKCLVAPTRHEGNAYILLEALACGVPLATFETGLACEMDFRCGFITDDISPHSLARFLLDFDNHTFSPREWAEEMADFDTFAAEWREFLESPA